jgi:hypothetical protein
VIVMLVAMCRCHDRCPSKHDRFPRLARFTIHRGGRGLTRMHARTRVWVGERVCVHITISLRDTVKEERSFGQRICRSFRNFFLLFHLILTVERVQLRSPFDGGFEGCLSPINRCHRARTRVVGKKSECLRLKKDGRTLRVFDFIDDYCILLMKFKIRSALATFLESKLELGIL